MKTLSAVNQLREIAESLNGVATSDGYSCNCPAHDDSVRSLNIAEKDGMLLFHCFAGCNYEDILSKLNLPKKQTKLREVKKNKTLVCKYEYQDELGNPKFVKRRFLLDSGKKTFDILRWSPEKADWVFSKDALAPVLYNLPRIKDGKDKTIILCEGEKDADNVNALEIPGYVATTNYEGAGAWCDEYTKQLAGFNVVVLEDNDPAGESRSHALTLALKDVCPSVRVVQFKDLKPKGDVSDWLETNPSRDEIHKRFNSGTAIVANPFLALREAEHEDYIKFVMSLPQIGELRREKLSNSLFCRKKGGQWRMIANLEDYIRGAARKYDCFQVTTFMEHLAVHCEDSLTPELLIDIPEWDGEDRLLQIAEIVKFTDLSQDAFYHLMLSFAVGIFKKLDDHKYQQPTIILQGPQGCGKDSLVQALFGGLEGYLKDLDIRANREVEAIKQLHTGLLFNIPEFERAAKTEIAALKYMLTTPTTDVRLSYDRASEQRVVRASFIASSNPKDVIGDSTGARRFWVFNAEYLGFKLIQHKDGGVTVGTGEIERQYPGLFCRKNAGEEQRQLLAQFYHFYQEGYVCPEEHIQRMQWIVAQMVPDSAEEFLLEEFEEQVKNINTLAGTRHSDGRLLYSLREISPIVTSLARDYSYSKQKVLNMINRSGRRIHRNTGNFYCATPLNKPIDKEPEIGYTDEVF